MSGVKHKFYELSAGEREGEKLNDIYKMMSQQDKSLAELLEKYDGKYEKESQFAFDSKTLDVNREVRSLSVKKDQSGSRIDHVGLELPLIGSVSARQPKKKNLHRNKPAYNIEKNPYFFELKSQSDKLKMKQVLQKAYFTQKTSKLNRSRSKLQSSQNYTNEPQKFSPAKSYQPTSNKNNTEQLLPPQKSAVLPQKQQNELPMPLAYFKEDINKDESSSEEGDVPLTYYEREYKAMIRAQCLEETNFLYFSKNEAMKDWTENLLLLFEKHDKQLSYLRKKCKYLEKFDDNYFSVDIFRDS